jgi:Domain of unknown function (DUF4249)
MKKIFSAVTISLICMSCEKVIDLDYKSNQSNIIIEGNITNQPGPYYVKITRSIGLSQTDDYPVINNAIVTIQDDAGNNETLTLLGNGTYITNTIAGVVNRTYTLTVSVDGSTYSAQSTIPQPVSLDSIKVIEDNLGGTTEYNIIPVYLDPIEEGNKYRFVLWVNSKLIKQHLVQNDEVKNGVINTEKLEINDNELELKQGDSISIEMQCVDHNVALFYNTLVLMTDNGPGGGTTPSNPKNNFTGNALGIFSAHTTHKKNTVIQ